MYRLFRPFLFNLDPELAHNLTISLLRVVGRLPFTASVLRHWFASPSRPVQVFGRTFKNPIGLAAGYDKDGLAWRGLACLGFSHIEIGTVTPQPQAGNPRPRVFRLVKDQALINRMGFPGRGADFVARHLNNVRSADLILGVNLGKGKDTPLEEAAEDYLGLIKRFVPLADYLAINVSSPNTVGLRRLQGRAALETLLSAISKQRESMLSASPELHRFPILVKLAPDLTDEELEDALEVIIRSGMDGVIATNTTLHREGLHSLQANETGGLSGFPLLHLSLSVVRKIHRFTQGKLPIIGVGGIFNADGVQAMLDAGAVLVQVYTGLIYKGPGLVKQILNRL